MQPAGDGSILGTILGNVAEAFGAPRAPGAPTSRGGVLPPSVTLPTAGRAPFSFTRTGEDARLAARFLPWAAVGATAALAGVLALAGAVFCARRGGSPWAMALLLGGLALVLQPVAAPGLRPSLAVLFGAGVALAVLAVLGAGLRLLRGNTALEEPPMPPLPPLPPEPPAAGSAS
jgi:hypothetical protein